MNVINKLRTSEMVEISKARNPKSRKSNTQNSIRALDGLAGEALKGTYCCSELKKCPNKCGTGGRKELAYLPTNTSIHDDFSNLKNTIEQIPPSTCPDCSATFITQKKLENYILIDVRIQSLLIPVI